MDCPLILNGAYGRLYKSADDAIRDYEAGKDFRIAGGPYCSIRDFPQKTVYLTFYPASGVREYVTYTPQPT